MVANKSIKFALLNFIGELAWLAHELWGFLETSGFERLTRFKAMSL